MTVSGDFISAEMNDAEEPKYPVVFGISLTPLVLGVIIALAGLGLAGYLLLNVVQPIWQQNDDLKQQNASKRQQLQDTAAIQQQIAEAQQQLTEAKALQADVLSLFATEESLDTLLLDVNGRIEAANARIADPERQATLSKFVLTQSTGTAPAPGQPAADVIQDGSFGSAVNGRLRQRTYDVAMEGSFAQTQSIIRNIERLQPLLVVRDLKSEVEESPLLLTPRGTPTTTPASLESRIKTSFKLVALLPAPPAAPAVPAAPADPAATPAPSP